MALARVTCFSNKVPDTPVAPGSLPPCPGSITITKRRPEGLGRIGVGMLLTFSTARGLGRGAVVAKVFGLVGTNSSRSCRPPKTPTISCLRTRIGPVRSSTMRDSDCDLSAKRICETPPSPIKVPAFPLPSPQLTRAISMTRRGEGVGRAKKRYLIVWSKRMVTIVASAA